ncbi:anaerobic C4-dicarboxylate transporter [Flavihumibacter petaseus]|uniref:Anaerobic C4-dicarboxylate transporter n=1 Tax=Flavihumibacter petaseus NBRC 106054 TaxID=1220578 RepID=A0A0E9MZ82_9BACT|nr:anaerobic C4-dicarboxylate transporter [Flavihumibacter petaseus]GAO42914.1 anaerobic C4-dicarboxylate transporter [Flavihumibacter petaseus NBRC 106054]
MIWIELVILLAAILIGARLKGIGLGVMGMLGMLIFVFGFHMKPADPPVDVMLIIVAIVTTAATLQAAGGLEYLVGVAEKVIRSNPSRITFIAPFTVYFLCLFAGTSHVVYSLLPIIADVAAKKRIRPERPLSVSVVASHVALTGSPMSAATAALAGIMAYNGAAIDIMKICIPSCLLGLLAGAIAVARKGKELNDDPVFREKMKDPAFRHWMEAPLEQIRGKGSARAKLAVVIFSITILLVVCCGAFPQMLPHFEPGKANFGVNADGSLKMNAVIAMITLAASGMMMLLTKTTPAAVAGAGLFNAMAVAVVAVFGVVWMSATFMQHNELALTHALGDIVKAHPWTFALAVFVMGMFMFSQAATTRAMMPLGVTLGLTHPALIAVFPAVNADFVLPGYPTLLAAIQFDRTGTTRIGKFVLNHSFMRPGLVVLTVAIALGFLLGTFFF